jgi:hypothetical protein
VTDTPQPETRPALDPRLVREVGRMADGRRITYYAWRDDADTSGDEGDD